MQEKNITLVFTKNSTTVHFPSDTSELGEDVLSAAVMHCLSFLTCDFIQPLTPPQVALSTPEIPLPVICNFLPDTVLAFLAISATEPGVFFDQMLVNTELWHHHFGHVSLDAT